MDLINAWYAGTWLEWAFSAFFKMSLLGLFLLGLRSLTLGRLDRPFASVWHEVFVVSLLFSLGVHSAVWRSFAAWLIG